MATHHVVAQGECLASIARQYGFLDYRTIYDHASNAALKKSRPDPNVLHPGDRLFIPDKDAREESRGTEKRHRFQLRRQRIFLDVILKLNDEPIANTPYVLRIGSRQLEGTTDGTGRIRHEVAATETSARLILKDPALEWDLRLGALDPLEEVSGVQGRLQNLGFGCGAIDGLMGPRTRSSLRQYQGMRKLSSTGEADGATRSRLRTEHDGG
ncbi:MAG TPA: peptidoglycan-binding protein [Methylomirabilota bacterium]|jgi:N-acetylmuramoyl-L-alanine amidase